MDESVVDLDIARYRMLTALEDFERARKEVTSATVAFDEAYSAYAKAVADNMKAKGQ